MLDAEEPHGYGLAKIQDQKLVARKLTPEEWIALAWPRLGVWSRVALEARASASVRAFSRLRPIGCKRCPDPDGPPSSEREDARDRMVRPAGNACLRLACRDTVRA